MSRDFNKVNNYSDPQESSKKWEIIPDQIKDEEYKDWSIEKINNTDEFDDEARHSIYSDFKDRIDERRKDQASSFAEAWDSAKYGSVHYKINSGKTTAERLRDKKELVDSILLSDQEYGFDGDHKIVSEDDIKRHAENELRNKLIDQEARRIEGLEKSGGLDRRYFGIAEWEDLARKQRDDFNMEIANLEKQYNNPSFWTKITNIIPFVKNRREQKFNDQINYLKSPTEAELVIYDVDPKDDVTEILKQGDFKHSDWYGKQSRVESGFVSKEEISEVYESRKGDIDKQNKTNKIKNIFEDSLSKGIAERLIDKGIKSEILNNPVFIENIGYLALKAKRGDDIEKMLKRIDVSENGDVSFNRSSVVYASDNDLEGVSEKRFFKFAGHKDGAVDVEEVRAVENVEKYPDAKNKFKAEAEYSVEHTFYDKNGDIIRIERDSVNRENAFDYHPGGPRNRYCGVEHLWENTIKGMFKTYHKVNNTLLEKEGNRIVLYHNVGDSGRSSAIVHANEKTKMSFDDPSVQHALKGLKK